MVVSSSHDIRILVTEYIPDDCLVMTFVSFLPSNYYVCYGAFLLSCAVHPTLLNLLFYSIISLEPLSYRVLKILIAGICNIHTYR